MRPSRDPLFSRIWVVGAIRFGVGWEEGGGAGDGEQSGGGAGECASGGGDAESRG
jgi:hypothetical protein